MTTYRMQGGARAFWLRVIGCVAALILPFLIKNTTIAMLSTVIPAFLAIINGGMFSSTMAQILVAEAEQENAQKKRQRHKK